MSSHGANAAVFIDRDNTLIANDGDLGDPAQVRLLRGAASAVASLKGLGYRIVVVTNQGGVARGKYGEDDVRAVHDRISETIHATTGLRIDRFYYCPFHPEGSVKKYKREHPWRKPQPGMLLEAARELDLDLSRCWMIGDQMRDVAAGRAAGTRTILLTRPGGDQTGQDPGHEPDGDGPRGADGGEAGVTAAASGSTSAAADVGGEPDFRCPSLTEAVRIIAQQRRPDRAGDLREPHDGLRARPPRLPTEPAVTAAATPSVSPVAATATASAVPSATAGTKPQAMRAAPTPAAATDTPVVSTPAAVPTDTGGPTPDEQAQRRPPATPTRSTPGMDETLRQILAELRGQRDVGGEFHFAHVAALVMVSLAVICLVAGLVTAQGDDGHFLRWLGASVVAELTAIAMLLLRPS